MSLHARAKQLCYGLIKDRSGNFGIMTALLATPLIVASGMAVDYTNATSERINLQELEQVL